mmetsp:Transcript_7635/g.7014  ORF Transcript_7635/g.7014 Transcript_7635/m.7014 type:complete len:124 (-) Transcript_7635:1037-1408(-)
MKEQQELTFTPKLVTKSPDYLRDPTGRPESYLLMYGEQVKEKHMRLRLEQEFHQEHEHKYQPKINKKSEKMVYEKLKATQEKEEENVDSSSYTTDFIYQRDKFSELYKEGMKRKTRLDKAYSI